MENLDAQQFEILFYIVVGLIGLIVYSQLAGVFEYFAGDTESAYVLMFCLGLAWARLQGDDAPTVPTVVTEDTETRAVTDQAEG